MNTANATGNPRLTLCGQTSFGLVKQDCRGAEGKRVGEMHGAREGWMRDRGKARAMWLTGAHCMVNLGFMKSGHHGMA